ncbi:MAG: zinc ribbon domain-containing protein [Solirubrobacteraceae bacterium]
MPPLAYFGIESSGLNLVVDLLILFVVVLYLSLIYWTYADASRRIEDPMLVGCATAAACFPFVGPIIYMILRPPEYLEDVRERELEVQAAESRLHQLDLTLCPHCDYRVEPDFVRCPSCLSKLKERCANCSRPLDRAWTICPYCEADVPGLSTPRSRRRRSVAKREEGLEELPRTGTDDEPPLVSEERESEKAAPVAAVEPAGRAASPPPRSSRSGGRRPRSTS